MAPACQPIDCETTHAGLCFAANDRQRGHSSHTLSVNRPAAGMRCILSIVSGARHSSVRE